MTVKYDVLCQLVVTCSMTVKHDELFQSVMSAT